MERAVNMTEKARISTTCITKFPMISVYRSSLEAEECVSLASFEPRAGRVSPRQLMLNYLMSFLRRTFLRLPLAILNVHVPLFSLIQ